MTSVMSSSQNSMMLMKLSGPDSRSISPLIPSPSREMKGIKLFRAISRKLARGSQKELNRLDDADSRSSSTDSCSSANSTGHCSRSKKEEGNSSGESDFRSVSPHHMSSSSSQAGSDIQTRPRHHDPTSAESIRKVFQNLNLDTRSHSCNNTKDVRRKSSKKTPKRILRSPVTYTYVKGLSGLPTQRIPRCQSRIIMNNYCGCGMQYMSGMQR